MPRYKVTHHSQEFACPVCGSPVYVGDTAWDDDGVMYCCAYCAALDREEWERRRDEQNGTAALRKRLLDGK
jgi:hypothetical protein